MTRCLLGIGSNLGDRAGQMDSAIVQLRENDDINVLAVSDWTETAPVGGPEKQLSYLNGAVLVETGLAPGRLLEALLSIERSLGRERDLRWGPRSVDLDLLLYGSECVDEPGLDVPHPWMAVRRFVLEPANQVASDMIHPVIGWSLGRLAENLRARPLVVAIVGMHSVQQVAAAHAAAREAGADVVELDSLLRSVDIDPECAHELRCAPHGSPAIVSNSANALELAGKLRQAIHQRMATTGKGRQRTNRQQEGQQDEGHSTDSRPMVFDYWWWEACCAAETAIDERAAGLPDLSPNLLIELSTFAVETGSTERRHAGPQLTLPADDLSQFQHDVTAAILCMQ